MFLSKEVSLFNIHGCLPWYAGIKHSWGFWSSVTRDNPSSCWNPAKATWKTTQLTNHHSCPMVFLEPPPCAESLRLSKHQDYSIANYLHCHQMVKEKNPAGAQPSHCTKRRRWGSWYQFSQAKILRTCDFTGEPKSRKCWPSLKKSQVSMFCFFFRQKNQSVPKITFFQPHLFIKRFCDPNSAENINIINRIHFVFWAETKKNAAADGNWDTSGSRANSKETRTIASWWVSWRRSVDRANPIEQPTNEAPTNGGENDEKWPSCFCWLGKLFFLCRKSWKTTKAEKKTEAQNKNATTSRMEVDKFPLAACKCGALSRKNIIQRLESKIAGDTRAKSCSTTISLLILNFKIRMSGFVSFSTYRTLHLLQPVTKNLWSALSFNPSAYQ